MPTGTVKWFSPSRGYGYIKPNDGTADVWVCPVLVDINEAFA